MPSTGMPRPAAAIDLAHHGGELGDRTAAQVVAVGEAAGHDDGVDALEVGVGVPEADGLGAGQAHRTGGVDVVERAGEGDDPDALMRVAALAQRHDCSRVTDQSSITVLASSDSAISASFVVDDGVVDLEFESLALPDI